MASESMPGDASAFTLSIPLPDPESGDPYTFLASRENAALALAAAYEARDADESIVQVLAGLTDTPMFLAVKECYRRDMRQIQREDKPDAARREEFVFDLILCRMYLAGMMQSKLPKAVRNA